MLTALSAPALGCAGLGHGCSFVLEGPGVRCSWVWLGGAAQGSAGEVGWVWGRFPNCLCVCL